MYSKSTNVKIKMGKNNLAIFLTNAFLLNSDASACKIGAFLIILILQ